MRFLIISLCLVLVSCGSYSKKYGLQSEPVSINTIENVYFDSASTDYVYKANITVYGNNFGGLLIVKKLAENNHRVAFTTEFGNKIFDFSFIDDSFKVNFILEDLNKKMLINILKQDFSTLIKSNLPVRASFKIDNFNILKSEKDKSDLYYYFSNSNLSKIESVKHQKPKTIFLFSEIKNSFAQKIEIVHQSIKLHINLKALNQ
ncbi:hypothetical protein PK35_11815 [Tamlana nanhaiensis]|uniref:Lipoprotein n=1 Tax=Neotamlana nanhaiensis TaxID=1382798 RepID=A0A0D7VZT3_9FLAO|nr:hypothetical protein [Tamlana nanhaiensis]KJD32117.1 hypothetical protein PK35_10930 [Tamlana nanhaiensis]KJD32279.1 hypothetical protein PK35_11815 [Tamlana nanhaiensis]